MRILLFLLFSFISFRQCILTGALENLLESLLSSFRDELIQGKADLKTFISSLSYLLPSLAFKQSPSLDVYRTEVEMIMGRGFSFEEHKILTSDSYILTAWRIYKNVTRKYPAVLNHGLLDSSFSYIINERNESLAYILADEGYDVWILNNRGNKYSKEHAEWNSRNDKRFWDFTWEDFAEIDLPANIEYVKRTTKSEKVIYIAHSQGTLQLFIQLSINPDFQNNLAAFFGLGPVLHVNHQQSFVVNLLQKLKIPDLLYSLNLPSVMFIPSDVVPSLGYLCDTISSVCLDVVSMICGRTETKHTTTQRMGVMASHEPGGTSVKNILHWMQLLRTDQIKKFDYGKEENIKKYGAELPPFYNIENLKKFNVKKFLFVGTKDYLANLIDFERLKESLNKEELNIYYVEDYNHLDYLWAVDAREKIYDTIVKEMIIL